MQQRYWFLGFVVLVIFFGFVYFLSLKDINNETIKTKKENTIKKSIQPLPLAVKEFLGITPIVPNKPTKTPEQCREEFLANEQIQALIHDLKQLPVGRYSGNDIMAALHNTQAFSHEAFEVLRKVIRKTLKLQRKPWKDESTEDFFNESNFSETIEAIKNGHIDGNSYGLITILIAQLERQLIYGETIDWDEAYQKIVDLNLSYDITEVLYLINSPSIHAKEEQHRFEPYEVRQFNTRLLYELFKDHDFSALDIENKYDALRGNLIRFGDIEMLNFFHERGFKWDSLMFIFNNAAGDVLSAMSRPDIAPLWPEHDEATEGWGVKLAWLHERGVYPEAFHKKKLLNKVSAEGKDSSFPNGIEQLKSIEETRLLPPLVKSVETIKEIQGYFDYEPGALNTILHNAQLKFLECHLGSQEMLPRLSEQDIQSLFTAWLTLHEKHFSHREIDAYLYQVNKAFMHLRWSIFENEHYSINAKDGKKLSRLANQFRGHFHEMTGDDKTNIALIVEKMMSAEQMQVDDLYDFRWNMFLLGGVPGEYSVDAVRVLKSYHVSDDIIYQSIFASFKNKRTQHLLKHNLLPLVEIWLQEKLDIHQKDEQGLDLLFYAVYYQDVEAVKLLLENGAQLTSSNEHLNHLDAALLTYEPGKSEMIKLLLEKGHPVDETHRELLAWLKEKYGDKAPKLNKS